MIHKFKLSVDDVAKELDISLDELEETFEIVYFLYGVYLTFDL